jgi:hypothetical protein
LGVLDASGDVSGSSVNGSAAIPKPNYVDSASVAFTQSGRNISATFVGQNPLLYKLTVPISNTGAGTTENNIVSYQMPAGTMGVNSVLKVHFYGVGSGAAGTCIFKAHFGTSATPTSNLGIIGVSTTGTANRALDVNSTLSNANAANAQNFSYISSASTNAVNVGSGTTAINTAGITYIGFTAQNSVASDNCALTEADIQILQ